MMIAELQKHRAAIDALCREYHVARLEVFGSAAGDSFDPDRSDIDFLVEFQRSSEIDAADQYFGLLEELEALLGRRVDLVCARGMRNPYLIRSVNQSRKLLYAA